MLGSAFPKLTAAIFAGVILLVGFCIGFLAGYYNPRIHPIREYGDPITAELLIKEIRPENIRKHLRVLTASPHLSGTDGDRAVVDYISKTWRENGLDPVKVIPYKVLLSYPNVSNSNRIEIRTANGSLVFSTRVGERPVRPEQNHSQIVPPFNAYSASGTPQGQIVYVNYGRVEDFQHLTAKVNISGCICIARYGKIFRGNKGAFAERFGCSGLILFSDPADSAIVGVERVYPDSWWLPGTGVQRGSLKLTLGDPLTPLYPATENAYRLDPTQADLPRIPVHPIGYDDARVLMESMAGEEAPAGWKGRLDIPYRIGPGYVQGDLEVRMEVSMYSEIGTIYDVIGFIEGSDEPDRYVILGNHHDAWVFGSVDPSSGTAVMLELSRAFGKMVERGWRPRRSIVFCAWGAEEQGLIGSREWVEQFGRILDHRAVAYLNVDLAVAGNFTLRGRSLPLLKHALFDVAKVVPNPDKEESSQGRRSVYDTWLHRSPEKDAASGRLTGSPKVPLLGSGSDFDPFISGVGVTSVDLRYSYDESNLVSTYPLYHSAYETFHFFETYQDPTFKVSAAVGQVWAELARRLADYVVLPLNTTAYAEALSHHLTTFKKIYHERLSAENITLRHIEKAVEDFTKAAGEFQVVVSKANKADQLMVRRLNDQMVQLERSFVDPPGILNRRGQRHVIFAPSESNMYAGEAFPGLLDSLFGIEEVTGELERKRRWNEVRKQLSILVHFVQTAAASLSPPSQI